MFMMLQEPIFWRRQSPETAKRMDQAKLDTKRDATS